MFSLEASPVLCRGCSEAGSERGVSALPSLGIQKNAQALQRMLKCPLLCRSSKAKLDAFQKPYIPKERRVNIQPTGCV